MGGKAIMIKILPLHFPLAKIIYNRFHRTNLAPIGHRESYILTKNTYDEFGNANLDYDDEDFTKWFNEAYPDNNWGDEFVWSGDTNGDPCLFSKYKILGILSIGNPVARFKDKSIFEITRICFLPHFNPLKDGFDLPSYFVKESIKQFKDNYKFKKIITYIHESQKGKYLEFAGFKKNKRITYSKNCKGWANRPNRLKSNLQPKIRYVYDN